MPKKYTVSSVVSLLGEFSNDLRGLGGITTYIKTVLCRGFAYRRPHGSISRGGNATRGLVMGRRLDRAFDAYVRGVVSRSCVRVPLCLRAVRSRLSSCGLTVCGSQVRVGVRGLGLRTELDGLCIDRFGQLWVLELKNTQQSIEEHRHGYDLPCPSCRVLRNGMVNSERVRHSLQTGFGMYAFLHCFPSVSSVRGIVVVNCSDGCVAYTVDFSVYGNRSNFLSKRNQSVVVDAC